MRLIGLLIVVLLLGGCNVVTSATPWFSEANAAGAPTLRPGVWSVSDKPRCRVRPKARLGHWPKCAEVTIFRAHDMLTLEGTDTPYWLSTGYILTATDPRILQMAPAQDDPDPTALKDQFTYLSLVPTAADEAGRIVEFRTYYVTCDGQTLLAGKRPTEAAESDVAANPDGAPSEAEPPKPAEAGPPAETYLTNPVQPLPGLHMKEEGDGCTAESREALLNAAKVSQQVPMFRTARWVRDGDR